jgi:4-amino-4-deoxy-L-arabinose transferase-like glycosyltransferase
MPHNARIPAVGSGANHLRGTANAVYPEAMHVQRISRYVWLLIPLWAIVVAAAVLSRPLLPIDETRYVSVAWEMWNSGNYLVPHMNGEVYSHKPPLLFWLITAGWSVFGVHEWVARLVGPAFALLDFFLVGAVARALWPDDERTRTWAGFALLTLPGFAIYSTTLMFDALLTCFVLIALLGIIRAAQHPTWRTSAMIAVGVGGGILAKGPVAFIYLIPAAIAAPWWSSAVRSAWKSFTGRVVLGMLAGVAIALCWAIPAAIFGGPEYREAILWTQTAGRVTQSFAHRRPFWFYLALMPVVLFPWAYWAPVRAFIRRGFLDDYGIRFCVAWFLGGLILFSLISGKQVHYLVPIFPAVALIAARAGAVHETEASRPIGIIGIYSLLAAATLIAIVAMPAESDFQLHPSIGAIAAMAAVIAGGVAYLRRTHTSKSVFWWTTVMSAVFLSALQWMVGPSLRERYDLAPFAHELAKRQAADVPIAHYGLYHGQFQFAGRLLKPLPAFEADEKFLEWCAAHPDGYFVKDWSRKDDPFPGETEFVSPFRGRTVGLVRVHAITSKQPIAPNQ